MTRVNYEFKKKKFPCLLTVRSRGNPRERGSAIDVASGYYESFWVPLSKFSFEAIAFFWFVFSILLQSLFIALVQ